MGELHAHHTLDDERRQCGRRKKKDGWQLRPRWRKTACPLDWGAAELIISVWAQGIPSDKEHQKTRACDQ
eukprot:scaffold12469_cov19-Tisochrysis_lutea.AAC.1